MPYKYECTSFRNFKWKIFKLIYTSWLLELIILNTLSIVYYIKSCEWMYLKSFIRYAIVDKSIKYYWCKHCKEQLKHYINQILKFILGISV